MEEFDKTVAVTLNGAPNQTDPNAVDHSTGYVIIMTAAPPIDDASSAEEPLLDLTAVQTAVDGNPLLDKMRMDKAVRGIMTRSAPHICCGSGAPDFFQLSSSPAS
jgi:hypothetical protein